MSGPHLASLTLYPVKSLDGKFVESAPLSPEGGLVGDRTYALLDADGAFVNGKAERRIHRIRSGFDLDTHRFCVRDVGAPPDAAASFDLPDDADDAAAWFTDYLGYEVTLQREPVGFPDDTINTGPTVISTATLETVADWYDDITPDEMRRRLRPNLEVGGVPAFWEDRLFGDHGEVVQFTVGETVLAGVNPCQRCVVPSRDPDTGEETPGFRRRFIEQRRETRPSWTDSDRFDHDYRLMVNTRVPGDGGRLVVGDPVAIQGTRPE